MDLAFFGTAGIKKKSKPIEPPIEYVLDKPKPPLREIGTNLKQDAVSELGQDDELKSLPWFVKPKFIQDAKGRRPDHDDYDNSTLFIPDDEFDRLTPVMQ